MRIKVGHGTNGDIYTDLEKVKACNFCTHFKGYGLHACTGHCFKLDKDINGGYTGNYSKVAQECNAFNVRPELIENLCKD
jgi:hypothetical protein